MADDDHPWPGGGGGGGGGDGGGGDGGGDSGGGVGFGGSDASGTCALPPRPPPAFADAAFSRPDAERIGRMLDHRLTKSDCKQRAGPSGRKLTYLESWKVIDLANKIFGWDGWSCESTCAGGCAWGGVGRGLRKVGRGEGWVWGSLCTFFVVGLGQPLFPTSMALGGLTGDSDGEGDAEGWAG